MLTSYEVAIEGDRLHSLNLYCSKRKKHPMGASFVLICVL